MHDIGDSLKTKMLSNNSLNTEDMKNKNIQTNSAWLVKGHIHACLVRKDGKDIYF